MASLKPFGNPYLFPVCNNRKTSLDFFRESSQTTTLFYPEINLAIQKNTLFLHFSKKPLIFSRKTRDTLRLIRGFCSHILTVSLLFL